MNVCMFVRSLLAHSIGGMELHVETLTRTLFEDGIDVTIISTSNPSGIEYEEKQGVKIYYLRNTKPGKYSKGWWINSVSAFRKIHEKEKFDVVHSQSAGAYYFLRKKLNVEYNLPVVASLHGTSIDEIKTKLRLGLDLRSKVGLIKNIFSYFFRDGFFLSKCNAIIATSDRQIEVIQKYYPVKRDNIHLVYNGIEEELFKAQAANNELQQKLNLGQAEKVILCVARLKKEKGIQNILSVFPDILKEFPKTRLLVIGDGEYRHELENMSMNLGIKQNVLFLGKMSYESLSQYFNLCDIFINSTVRENGYDLTILQGMACGKPVVVSDIGSVFSVIEHGKNGFIYPRNNIKELRKIVMNLLRDEAVRSSVGSNARKTVEDKFSLTKMAEKTVEVYNSLLGVKHAL